MGYFFLFCFFTLFLTAQKYSLVMHLILNEEQCQIAYIRVLQGKLLFLLDVPQGMMSL